jgi:hypothetical protein
VAFVVATGKGDGSIRVARAFGVGWVPGKGDFVRVATNFQYAVHARVLCNDQRRWGITAISFRVHVNVDTFDFTDDARAQTRAHVKFGGVFGDLFATDFVVLLRVQRGTCARGSRKTNKQKNGQETVRKKEIGAG